MDPVSYGTLNMNASIASGGAANAQQYSGLQIVEHEIDAVLGIGGGSTVGAQQSGSAVGAIGPMDRYRYSVPGVSSFSGGTSTSSYFSIDGGKRPSSDSTRQPQAIPATLATTKANV